MAIFRPGAMIGAISGALGGVTFSNSRGSRVIRHRPAVQGGAAQNHGTAQANFRFAQRAWRTLTDTERAAWRTYAPQVPVVNRLGETHALSGFQAFVRFNIRIRMLALPLSTTPTSIHVRPAPTTLDITSDLTLGIKMLLGPEVSAPFYRVFIYGAMNMSLTLPRAYFNWRLIGIRILNGAAPETIDDLWEDVWTLPLLGQPIGIRADSYTQDMRQSGSIIATTTTVP